MSSLPTIISKALESGIPSVCQSTFPTVFSKTTWPIQHKFQMAIPNGCLFKMILVTWPPWPYMVKLYFKKFSWTKMPIILGFGMSSYQVCSNNNRPCHHWPTLRQDQIWFLMYLHIWGNSWKCDFSINDKPFPSKWLRLLFLLRWWLCCCWFIVYCCPYCLLVLCVFCPRFIMQYLVYFLVLQSSRWEKRACRLTLIGVSVAEETGLFLETPKTGFCPSEAQLSVCCHVAVGVLFWGVFFSRCRRLVCIVWLCYCLVRLTYVL